jgi:hypothetical protein
MFSLSTIGELTLLDEPMDELEVGDAATVAEGVIKATSK